MTTNVAGGAVVAESGEDGVVVDFWRAWRWAVDVNGGCIAGNAAWVESMRGRYRRVTGGVGAVAMSIGLRPWWAGECVSRHPPLDGGGWVREWVGG